MKLAIILLIAAFLMGCGAFFYINHELNRVADETPHTCPEWLMDSPQKGCEQ